LLLYALIQTTKTLLALRNNLHNNETNHIPIFKRYNIWDNKQALLLNKAKQLSTHALKRILVQCKIADAIIKVESPGNIWVALQEIVLYLLDTTMMPYACTF
jgi:DNA polymerase III delta subunit